MSLANPECHNDAINACDVEISSELRISWLCKHASCLLLVVSPSTIWDDKLTLTFCFSGFRAQHPSLTILLAGWFSEPGCCWEMGCWPCPGGPDLWNCCPVVFVCVRRGWLTLTNVMKDVRWVWSKLYAIESFRVLFSTSYFFKLLTGAVFESLILSPPSGLFWLAALAGVLLHA